VGWSKERRALREEYDKETFRLKRRIETLEVRARVGISWLIAPPPPAYAVCPVLPAAWYERW